MTVVFRLLLVVHLLSWAVVLGAVVTSFRGTPRLPKGTLHGVLGALVTGIAMAGLASAGVVGREPEPAWMAVKLLVALVITGLVVYGTRNPDKVTRGTLGAVAGLTVVNVAVAVLWR